MKRNCLSALSSSMLLLQPMELQQKRGFKMNKRPTSFLLGLISVLGIFLLSLSAPCQGSSLHVRREISSRREPYQLVQLRNGDTDDISWPSHSHSIRKREAVQTVVTANPAVTSSSTESSSSSKIKSWPVRLNDSHNQLLVFWAGEDVILCLAKDANSNSPNSSTSTLWISRDYGGSFTNSTSLLVQNQSGGSGVGLTPASPVLDGFFNHPSHNGHFAFTDIVNKVIYTTKNYGAEFTVNKVDFVPDEVLFDPHSDTNIVAYEKSTTNKQMWVSIDFGKTWTKVQDYVKSLSWDESVMPAVLYLQREEPTASNATLGSRTVILKSNSLFLEAKDTEVIISDVEEFEIKDDFMFATQLKENGTYDLLISYKRSSFKKAIFPAKQATKHFFIADVSTDGQIFVCVVLNESVSNLYVGSFLEDEENPKFTLSLERILYFKPNVTWSESWLNEVAQEPFVDLHPVEGLRGVYIASQLKPSTVTNGKFNINEVISLITYDQGGKWSVLNPPEFEHDGRPIYCQYSGGNCSLHISQRLSELYPRTRAVPVLSKKSAVGLVLATGTVNTTLKGHLGVYLSTDGAVSWRQILQGNYLYAFGDHGGIIVATKMYRIGDDTNELYYSIDEGETWEKYQFYTEKVRIMGLMTEPGENTTTFFIFGSLAPSRTESSSPNPRHIWVLIKVDFRDVFDRVCEKDDYKMWSPWDGENGKNGRQCLLGRKEIYERRIPTHRCYNGRNFVRSVTNETCMCKRDDFECDFGYVLDTHAKDEKEWECVKDNSESSPGVRPEWCRPSEQGLPAYYNKTKGYRKVPGDTCIEGDWVSKYLPEQIPCEVKEEPEFMLVAKRDSVLRIDLNHFERVEILPLTRVQAVIAVDFNLKNNCIFWSDVHHKTIMKLHLDGNSTAETLVASDLRSVEGLAFDWMSKNLYFSDGGGAKIEVVRVDNRRMRKRLLAKPTVEKPRGIAVHPEKGYIFWTDWSTQNPCIGRAHLDGSNPEKIVTNRVGPGGQPIPPSEMTLKWPNGITVDFKRHRLFWVDAHLDRMFSSDLNGGNIQIVLEKNPRISHAFAVGVYKNTVYWDDWTTRGIYSALLERVEKDSSNFSATTDSIFKIKGDLPRLMDLKVYGVDMQQGENNCSSEEKSNCSSLCFVNPNGTASCQCPDGFIMQNHSCVCPDGKKPTINANGTHTCESKCEDSPTLFRCRTHKDYCIVATWRCDGENDCADWSDEEGCDSQVCEDPNEFRCNITGRCIPNSFVCDYDDDCGPEDRSDEENCASKNGCDPHKHFKCANGQCILNSWRCDEDEDCTDGSDEKNCTDLGKNATFSCSPSEWKCPNENKCLSLDWVCDFDHDCIDGSDERNCTRKTCPDWKFACKTSGHCIMKTWECDTDKDCPDGSDEHDGCPPVTTELPEHVHFTHANCSKLSQMYECLQTKECIPIYWKCDNVKDCNDGSDELGCAEDTEGPHSVTVAPPTSRCDVDQWRCNNGVCIASYAVCDEFPDCSEREDEKNCHNSTFGGCPVGMRKCGQSRACVPQAKWCDKKNDCPNRADEMDCSDPSPVKCNSGQLMCDDGCQPLYKQCDGREDCYDGLDEKPEICTHAYQRVYQVDGIAFPEIDSTWFEMEWWLPPMPSGKKLQFIPEICEIESKHCWNITSPTITARQTRVDRLDPFKRYSATLYVKDPTSGKIYTPFTYKNVTTGEGESSAPYAVSVTQNSTDNLFVRWKRPHTPNGKIKGYKVYFSPPVPHTFIDTIDEFVTISNKQSDPIFLPGENYTFWVTALNGRGEGKASEPVIYTYNGEVAFMTELSVKGTTDNSVKLIWEPSNSNHVDEYTVILQTDVPGSMYTFQNKTKTSKKVIDYSNLTPGTRYKVTVIPNYHGMYGTQRTVSFTTTQKSGPIPTVDGLKVVQAQNGQVKLSWRPTKVSNDYQYGIYYGKSAQELADRRHRLLTAETQAEIKDLEACENYLFDIGLVNTKTRVLGPLTEHPQTLVTKMNPVSPPKSVSVQPYHKEDSDAWILVTWKSPCDVMDRKIGYNITIQEITHNKVYGVSNVEASQKTEFSYPLQIRYGGHFELTVSTNVEGGKSSAPVLFDGPAIPFPEKIQQCHKCGPLTIMWDVPKLPKLVSQKGRHSYVVWLSDNPEFKDASRYESEDNSYVFEEVHDNKIYYVAVSVKDAEGWESPRSTPMVVQHVDGASPLVVIPGSSALAITITVLVIIILLVSVLAVFVVRHKRLQTSFLNFASSHYSSSSGAATFQQTMEDADSPVIRGFSDDEPLLVA